MNPWFTFAAGVFLGVFLGILLAGLLHMASRPRPGKPDAKPENSTVGYHPNSLSDPRD